MKTKTSFARTTGVFFLLLLCLSGCTKQRNTDIPEFCKRFNTVWGEQTLNPENFFCEQAESAQDYNCHLQIADNLTALLTLRTDTDGTVTALQLTCIPERETYTEDTFNALYATYTALCAVLTVQDSDAAENAVRTAGILPESLGFSAHGFVGEAEKHRYSIFSGEQYLTLFCERI